ncbi:hypothetical protein N656DRAFT_559271 [Canariomyces notabilis]|uniref:Uncharacterized protein n=1 Tax=Canariomyces notabilis TaxID=2074819 RepID=A0AAN6QBF3_9PEZI|nr:hypothetical protein N656DRAFT_559271 [Canariomyces arenarius]
MRTSATSSCMAPNASSLPSLVTVPEPCSKSGAVPHFVPCPAMGLKTAPLPLILSALLQTLLQRSTTANQSTPLPTFYRRCRIETERGSGSQRELGRAVTQNPDVASYSRKPRPSFPSVASLIARSVWNG